MWEQQLLLRGFDHDRWNGIRRGYKDGGDCGAHLLIEAGNDNSFTQSLLLLPQTRNQYEQYDFEPGRGSGFEAMVGMMEHAVCSYQPRIEAGNTSSSMQSRADHRRLHRDARGELPSAEERGSLGRGLAKLKHQTTRTL